jgi:hypothetical protein
MVNKVVVVGSESEWLSAIAKAAHSTPENVKLVLAKHGIRAQSTPPRAKKVAFSSLSFSGVRKGTKFDGPFAFDWNELGPGLWAVMSDRNHRGKSSVMNMLSATLRGEFPGKIKADVWKWLDTLQVIFRIENTEYRTLLRKATGVEDTAKIEAFLSRKHGETWVDLYAGSAGADLQTQTESLFLEELGFTKIHGANQNGTTFEHSWAAIASALSITSASNGKALFGEILMDGLPLRLLQLFIGLPWISTMTAAATAVKLIDLETKRKESTPDHFAGARTRLRELEDEIAEVRANADTGDQRKKLREDISALDQSLAEAHLSLVSHRNEVDELGRLAMEASEIRQEAAHLLQQLKDEQDAGYVFRKLRPVCCPSCESPVIAQDEKSEVDDGCPLCKIELPASLDSIEERVHVAQSNYDDATSSLKSAQKQFNRAKQELADAEGKKSNIEAQIAALVPELDARTSDAAQKLMELDARARELRALLSDVPEAPAVDVHPDRDILEAAVKSTRQMFDELQGSILEDLSGAIKDLATKFGVQNLATMSLDGGGRLKIKQGDADTHFTGLTEGERLRVKIAAALAAVEVARKRGLGRHPGLLMLDSPGSEEVASEDFQEMLLSVSNVAKDMGGVQVIIGTVYRNELEGVIPVSNRRRAENGGYLF